MASKQLYFHITANDLVNIQTWMDKNKVILIGVPINEESEVLETIEFPIKEGQWNLFYFTHRDFYPKLIRFDYIENQKKYFLNILKSYAIEFSRPEYLEVSKELKECRLYTALDYYENNVLVRKNEIFKKWADKIYKNFKKEFLIKSNQTYVSTDAMGLFDSGIKKV